MTHPQKRSILVISNGEAEDAIACNVIEQLNQDHNTFLAAPLVSHGAAYLQRNIPICCPTASMPSCGFSNQSIKALSNDFRSGLSRLLIRQLRAIRKIRHRVDYVITCGDVLPQFFAYLTGKPCVNIFTALSEYYLRNEVHHYKPIINTLEQRGLRQPCVFSAFDRYLMRSRRCRGVFVRDQLTHNILKKFSIPVYYCGNPMMDNLEYTKEFPEFKPELQNLMLLPGSRTPEAYTNLTRMVDVLKHLTLPCNIAVSLVNNVDLKNCSDIIKRSPIPIFLYQQAFSELLNCANTVFSMCGTAAEQAVGKGIPVVSMPGKGPQFSPKFADAQQRLLGKSYFLVMDGDAAVAKQLQSLLHHQHPESFVPNGRQRMGLPGGSKAIAYKIEALLKLQPQVSPATPQLEKI